MSFEGQCYATLGDLPVQVSYSCVYEPARISGPPEECWPDGSEMEVINVLADGCDIAEYLSEKTIASLEERCWEDFHSGREE